MDNKKNTEKKYSLSDKCDANNDNPYVLINKKDDLEIQGCNTLEEDNNTSSLNVDVSRCEKCGIAILDEDRLCSHCYKRKVIFYNIIFLVAYIAFPILTDKLFGVSLTLGAIFWGILYYYTRRQKYINERRLYHSIPLTPDEIVRKIRQNYEFAEKCKEEFDIDDFNKYRDEFLIKHIAKHKNYSKLKKSKNNLISEHPQYLSFVTNMSSEEGKNFTYKKPAFSNQTGNENSSNKNKDLKFNNFTIKNNSKLLITITIILSVFSTLALGTIIYQQNIIQEQELKNTELIESYNTIKNDHSKISNDYDKLNEKYNAIFDEYDFYHNHAVCVDEDDTYYHTYSCPELDCQGFWIYNSEAVESKGYTRCPRCSNNQYWENLLNNIE